MTDLENSHRDWILHVLLGFYIRRGGSYGHGVGAFIISLYEMPSRKLMPAEADSDEFVETRGSAALWSRNTDVDGKERQGSWEG